MKKTILFVVMVLTLQCSFAQEGKNPGGDNIPTTSGQIPSMVTDRFSREYPGITGNWTVDGENYRVEFVDPQSHLGHIIVYDRNGDVIRRESELDGPSSPNAINQFYQKNYPGEELKTWSVTERDGTMSYYSRHNNEILKFDKNGAPVQLEKQQKQAVPQKAKSKG